MEAKNTTFNRPTHEEVREMFRRAKAHQQFLEEEARKYRRGEASYFDNTKP